MRTDECDLRVANGVEEATHDEAMREYLASAARDLGGPGSDFASVEHRRHLQEQERAIELEQSRAALALEQSRAALARAVRTQMRAQRRASMTLRERVVDRVLTLRIVQRRRARQLPEGFNDRVSDQLDRVKAVIQ